MTKKNSIKKWLIIIAVVIVILAALIGFGLYQSIHGLTVTNYTLSSDKLTDSVRIVQLTDLHNSEFGSKNVKLIEKVKEQKPDLILITGDLLNSDEERTDIATEMIEGMSQVAPVFVSYGNHEAAYEKKYGTDLRKLYTDAGAAVLEFNQQDLTVKGQDVRLGGLYGYCMPPKYLKSGEAKQKEIDFLNEFQNTDALKILLCHMPECWQVNTSLDEWDIDCVLAGHVHGGQIRIPFVGGVWAPDRGWWPGEEAGLYPSEDGRRMLILSRGLGNREKIPRFNNVPEILTLDYLPA